MLQEIKMAHAIRDSKMNTNRYNSILKYFYDKLRIIIFNVSYRWLYIIDSYNYLYAVIGANLPVIHVDNIANIKH